MWPDRVSNPRPLTYKSGALPTALRGRANNVQSKAIKFNYKGSYDKQNLTLVALSYEVFETRLRLVSLTSYEMTSRVRYCIYKT